MHILFLTDNFPPEVNAPASRTHEHCREWVAAGHQVTVVTCAPNFPKGQVFAGYRNRWKTYEQMDGIRVIRVWTYIAANSGFGKRVLDYMSFMVTAFLAGLPIGKVNVIVGTSPQFFTVCAAWMLSVFKRKPFVFELRDLWPESIKAVGAMRQSAAINMLERLELFLYRRARLIVSVTGSFKKILAERGINEQKIAVVTNGVDMQRFAPRPKNDALVDTLGLRDKFVVGYIGTHGMAHGLETLLEAADRLSQQPDGLGVKLLFLGDGSEKASLLETAQRRNLSNVVFVDTVPKNQVADYWALLDASVIHLRRTELFGSVIPSKMFECMGMGVPILHGVAGESAEIVRQEEVGLVFESENTDEFIKAIKRLLDNSALHNQLKANCLTAATRFDRRTLASKMLELLKSVGRAH